MALKFNILPLSEFARLENCIQRLADYHNSLDTPFKGSYPISSFSERAEEYNNDKGTFHIEIAENENSIIMGFCISYIEKQKGEIKYLFLDKGLRGMGYGEKLMDDAINWLKENGAKNVELLVVDGNPTISFYEKYGFLSRTLIMRKNLE